ncbi:MAG: hypothetical protein AAB501_03180 [Patescibacteria group bacterium]
MDQIIPKISKEQFITIYRALPEDIKVSLFAEETAEKMMALKNKHSLSDENFYNIVRVTGRIMLGAINIKAFIQAIVNTAKLDNQKAQTIAQDINQTIFQPVRVSLMQVHGIDENTNTQNTNYKQYPTNQNQQYKIPPRPQQPPLRQGFVGQAPSARNYGVSQQPVKLTPPAYQPNYNNNDAQKKREEVLNKIRQQPPSAKPASFYFSRNIRPKTMKAKHNKRVTKYNSFFS